MFRITMGKGFNIKFENGYSASVQFGGGNYCSNRDAGYMPADMIGAGERGSKDAECAVITPDGEFMEMEEWGDQVNGYMTPKDVLDLLIFVEALK